MGGRRSCQRGALAVLGLVMIGSSAVTVLAHEIGTTRVSVVLSEAGRYQIEVRTDAVSLLQKLESVAGEPAIDTTADPAALESRFELLAPTFQQRMVVAFDDQPVQPAISWTVSTANGVGAPPVATILIGGQAPAHAHRLTWRYAWTFTSYPFTVQPRRGGSASTEWLQGDQTSTPVQLDSVAPGVPRLYLAARYVALGFTHILPKGLDHVLFVLGIFLVSRRARPVLLQVSAFTIAHSLTLGLSIYGVLTLPSSIIEPAIALSIAYIAIENVLVAEIRPWRYALVFAFGLLHGLGFSGVLREVGLPQGELLTALLGFNTGVELGQIAVIGLAYVAVGYWFNQRTWYRRRIVLPASACIALFGLYWTLERVRGALLS